MGKVSLFLIVIGLVALAPAVILTIIQWSPQYLFQIVLILGMIG